MAETRYLFFPEDAHFTRPNGAIVKEEVLVNPDAEPIEGKKPEVKVIPVIRTMAFFLEMFITTHPLFSLRRGHAAFAAGLRILDIARANEKNAGEWIAFDSDDTRMIKKCFSAPKGKKDDKADQDLCAADMREMSQYESIMYREFIESCMNPMTNPPKVDVVGSDDEAIAIATTSVEVLRMEAPASN